MSAKEPPITLPDTDDPYALLDVRPGASADQIRRAYLRRVKIFKPDRHPAQFRRIREAYDRLREQEAWFDAWRQANEVVRQAQQAIQDQQDQQDQQAEDPQASPETTPSASDSDNAPADEPAEAASAPASSPEPSPRTPDSDSDPASSSEPPDSAASSSTPPDSESASDPASSSEPPDSSSATSSSTPPDSETDSTPAAARAAESEEPTDVEPPEDDTDSDPAPRRRPRIALVPDTPHNAPDSEPDAFDDDDLEPTDEALWAEAQQQQALDDDEASIERVVAELRAEHEADGGTFDELSELSAAVHGALLDERYTEAADRLLDPQVRRFTAEHGFTALLLEVCCAVVWAAPAKFDALVARYGDLIAAQDTEFRDGALLHRRTLTEELSGWRDAVAEWPELHRFAMLGSSLRAQDEAELGLILGRRAADDPRGLLEVLTRAAVAAPGIVALYVGMAERWSQRYEPPFQGRPGTLPTVTDAAAVLCQTVQTHRRVRWEQFRPVLISAFMGAILAWTSTLWLELLVVGLVLVLWAWRAWASSPQERIYALVLRPVAASWLWTTGASPDEIAVAFAEQLPASGTWAAMLHPGDLSDYPHLLGNDLILLAFGVTAPMIPQMGRR